ncbi:hypothetical protein SAMN04488123_12016 [Natribacillus halophilus]|uniref:Phage protein n=2 Tax=Natribacillus halophilus TaxID=549003 RepID=A0A1G8RS42_9BACI|nr:hypothetical protein SAMN04488123_12016 [Natribacillus halophilus]
MSDAEIDHLTLKNYGWRMKAIQLKRADIERDLHLQSWLNQQAKATKETGQGKNKKSKPVFKNFQEFYDHEKRVKQIEGKKTAKDEKKARMAEAAKRVNQGA